jgi:cathepsin L
MKVILALASLLAISFALSEYEYQAAFSMFMHQYQKSYDHLEFAKRYNIFKSNLDFINAHNKANKTFTVGMNKFGDLSIKEFSKIYLGTRITKQVPAHVRKTSTRGLPASVDWRQKGAVTHVKNQGQCGSCWSFSTTGSVEGCHFLSTQKLVSLSEQNLVDCSTAQGNQGCDGGLMDDAFQYIISNGGIDTESSYPYTAEDGTCSYSASNSGATIKGYTDVNSGDEGDLQKKVAATPTSVAIDASHNSFQFYTSGVYNEPDCSTSQLDHGVLAVGYGHDSSSGSDYWLVKNSWGTDWGQQGYIWMSRNANNQCGIATAASIPTGCA